MSSLIVKRPFNKKLIDNIRTSKCDAIEFDDHTEFYNNELKNILDSLNTNIIYICLTGCLLDFKQICILSDFIKINITVKSLVLNKMNIDHISIKIISDAFKINNTIEKLYLFNNNIGSGVKYIIDMLKINTSIKKLYLSQNNIPMMILYIYLMR